MAKNEILTAYVAAFVDELVRSGGTHAVISPGSRSTPLAMLMAEHPSLKVWMHIDERSAGFFALGMAKAQRYPVVLVCSSGTAAANYFPAVVEANQGRVPLIVCTADRPHELRDVGAPQAIQQIGLYGAYAKWFVEMALPENTPDMLRYARTVATRAVATAGSGPQGPVHLNFPFREPLVPEFELENIWDSGRQSVLSTADTNLMKDNAYTKVIHGERKLDDTQLASLAQQLASAERGLIVCGPLDQPQLAEAVIQLAESLQYPILADPLSQLRYGKHESKWIIDTYDTFLRDEQIVNILRPQVIIRFGAMPVSKAFLLYLKRYPECRQIVIDQDQGWLEPTLLADDMIYAEPVAFCRSIVKHISLKRNVHLEQATDSFTHILIGKWARTILDLNQLVKQQVTLDMTREASEDTRYFYEGRVFHELLKCLPDGSTLFVGNSMPVRDLDTYGLTQNTTIRVLANRGANGIDGVVSTALGVSAIDQPLVLTIGDLSFFHDLNGLLAAKLHQLHVTIVLINNDGGGIFSFLPQATKPAHFETLFGTPIGLDFQHVVEMYGGSFVSVQSWKEFSTEVNQAIAGEGLHVIEVRTERRENVAMHREFWQRVAGQLREVAVEVTNN